MRFSNIILPFVVLGIGIVGIAHLNANGVQLQSLTSAEQGAIFAGEACGPCSDDNAYCNGTDSCTYLDPKEQDYDYKQIDYLNVVRKKCLGQDNNTCTRSNEQDCYKSRLCSQAKCEQGCGDWSTTKAYTECTS